MNRQNAEHVHTDSENPVTETIIESLKKVHYM